MHVSQHVVQVVWQVSLAVRYHELRKKICGVFFLRVDRSIPSEVDEFFRHWLINEVVQLVSFLGQKEDLVLRRVALPLLIYRRLPLLDNLGQVDNFRTEVVALDSDVIKARKLVVRLAHQMHVELLRPEPERNVALGFDFLLKGYQQVPQPGLNEAFPPVK